MQFTLDDKETAKACNDLAKIVMDASTKWFESAPGNDSDKIKVLTCTFAKIAARSAAGVFGDPDVACEFILSALAESFGAKLVVNNGYDDESPNTFMGKPIVGHC